MTIFKKLVLGVLVCAMVFSFHTSVYATSECEESIESYRIEKIEMEIISDLAEQDENLYDFVNYSHCDKQILLSAGDANEYELQEFFSEETYIGYVIWDAEQHIVCEISKGYSAYSICMQQIDVEDVELWYDCGNYYIVADGLIYYINEFGVVYKTINTSEIATCAILPNVTPQRMVITVL